MLYFSKFRIISVILISLFFILIASSNLFKFENNLLNKKINLGLDLQGGSYLLLEIDNNPVIEQKIQNLSITIRNYFKDKNIRIKNLKILGQKLYFSVDENYKQTILDTFNDEESELNPYYPRFKSHQLDITEENNIFFVNYSTQGIVKLKTSSQDQALEIVRRRIDEIGTNEPNILKRGNDRILVELPGLDEDTKNAVLAGISGQAINALGGNVSPGSVVARSTGQILNNNLELLFQGVNLRSFPFSVTFSPRNYEETERVRLIIRYLKQTMAPKTCNEGGRLGTFLKSPDVFSLRYLHNGQDHPFLNSFKLCALTGLSVNYTNAGTYASYSDGTPVNIRLNMSFKELNPVYAEDYDGGDAGGGVGY